MANIPTYDPGSSEARSPLIAGLTEAANKISSILSMKSKEYSNEPLEEVYISTNDRYRIYQVDMGRRLWLASPAPIIRKNGNIIKPETDYFSIDYVGGSIAFDENYRLISSDAITADFTCVTGESTVLSEILNDIIELKTNASHDKGFYETEEALKLANPTGVNGDNAIVGETDTIWVWDSGTSQWVDTHKGVDLSNYYTKPQTDLLLSAKEPTISKKEDANPSNFYYSGEKQWVDLIYKIRNTNLTGLDTSSANAITEVDTIISALGKLQAQLNPLNNISNRIESVENKNTEQDDKLTELENNKFNKTGGDLNGWLNAKSRWIGIQHDSIDPNRNVEPSTTHFIHLDFFNSGGTDVKTNRMAKLEYIRQDGVAEIRIAVNDPSNNTSETNSLIGIGYKKDSSGEYEVYTKSPKPKQDSNDNNIATTSWVRDTIKEGGTLSGALIAGGEQDISVSQVRNIYAGTSDMEAGVTPLPTGSIYFVYE